MSKLDYVRIDSLLYILVRIEMAEVQRVEATLEDMKHLHATNEVFHGIEDRIVS